MTDWTVPDPIRGDGVSLRAPSTSDVARLVEICSDPEIARWTRVPSPYGPPDAEAFVDSSARLRRAGTGVQCVIVDERDVVVGSIGLGDIDRVGLTAELGYLVGADARGRGLASRAVTALIDWGFRAGLQRIQAQVMVGNAASVKLLRRVGFVEEGVLRSVPAGTCGVDRDRIDMHVFSQIAADRQPLSR